MKQSEILFDLHFGKKSESNPHILKDDFRKLQRRYKNYQQVYTDGSKEDSKVGCAVISDNYSNMKRLPDASSIFTVEAKAVDALWSPARKGLTSWLSFVMSNCEVVTFPLVSWVRCGA